MVELLSRRGKYKEAMQHLKYICNRWPHSWGVWNEYCRISTKLGSAKASSWVKFVGALKHRHPTSLPLMLLQGHVWVMNRLYPEALEEYCLLNQVLPDEPLVLLSIGIAFINHAMTRRVTDRNRAVLVGFAFLQQYEKQRDNPHESAYNIGRAAHQLGLMSVAHAYYEKALRFAPGAVAKEQEGAQCEVGNVSAEGACGPGQATGHVRPSRAPDVLMQEEGGQAPLPPQLAPCDLQHSGDLTRDIAHNLVQLYRYSGAVPLAREIMRKYLVV